MCTTPRIHQTLEDINGERVITSNIYQKNLEVKVQLVVFNCSAVFYTSQVLCLFSLFLYLLCLWPTAGGGQGRSFFGSFSTAVWKRETVQGRVPVLIQAEGQINVCLNYIPSSCITLLLHIGRNLPKNLPVLGVIPEISGDGTLEAPVIQTSSFRLRAATIVSPLSGD